MIPKYAIERAIEGGWLNLVATRSKSFQKVFIEGLIKNGRQWQEIALDPTFWQALGKALGWGHEHMRVNWGQEDYYIVPLWQFYASKFTNLIVQGKDTAAFWEEILKQGV